MEFIHDRKSNILFSLYGSKVNRIRIHNKTLTLTVDEMYQLVDGEERAFSGEISFKDCDVDLCKVLIFNKTLREGRFTGKSICLHDFMNEYGIDKRKDRSDTQDEIYVMVAQCTLDITGEMKGFPYADIRLASGAFSQGISNDNIREINKDVNFSKFEQGTSITVDIPFLIHSISFPHSINADKLNKEEWQLYFSVTPGKYVRMGK